MLLHVGGTCIYFRNNYVLKFVEGPNCFLAGDLCS